MRRGPQVLPVQAPPLSRQALTSCSRCACQPSSSSSDQGEQAGHRQPQPGHDAAPPAARAAKRSFQAGRAPGNGSAVAS